MAAAKKEKYIANWRLEGVLKEPIQPGQVVELVPEEAAPFVEGGVLSPVEQAKNRP